MKRMMVVILTIILTGFIIILGMNSFSEAEEKLPNIRYVTPRGWDAPLVASNIKGERKTSELSAGEITYISFAVRNEGSGTSGNFYIYLYLDDNIIGKWISDELRWWRWTRVEDFEYKIPAGLHTLRMVIDPLEQIKEADKGDNVYDRTFLWK